MKKIFSYILAASIVFGFTSCDGIFDSLEGDLTKMSASDLTATEAGLDRLMSTLYQSIPMGAFSELDKNTPIANDSAGGSGYTGGVYYNNIWNYTYVRDINFFLKSIDEALEKGVISQATYDSYKGEALFIRAYYYFVNVRYYGGVPIVTEPLDDYFDGGENAGLYIPRSTEKETWDFVLSELDEAARLLPESRSTGAYRATKWAALGLKSRVALWAASVSKYWNRAAIGSNYEAVKDKLAYMEASYASNYYQQCIQASEAIINSGQFKLYGAKPGSVAEAVKNYEDLFQSRKNDEFIFGRSYVNGVATNSNGIDLKNSPNQVHGSGTGVWRFGCYGVTLDLVDEFDDYGTGFSAVDGTLKTRVDGNEDTYIATPSQEVGKNAIKDVDYIKYDSPADAFKNKDARFQAYVIYPWSVFRGTQIIIQGGMRKSDGTIIVYDDSNPSETVGGKTYYGYGAINETYYSGFYYRGHTNDGSWYTTGFGLKKFLNPTQSVSESQNPWYDIRYTEILLNYCEAQVELGGTNAGKSKDYLNDIRRRAYFQDQKEATLENVLHERLVELAFEDDYGSTLYRRRAYFNRERDLASQPNGGRKHALIPMLDLQGGSPKYFLVRANAFDWDTDVRPSTANYNALSYYASIPSYTVNRITRNPIQE